MCFAQHDGLAQPVLLPSPIRSIPSSELTSNTTDRHHKGRDTYQAVQSQKADIGICAEVSECNHRVPVRRVRFANAYNADSR